MQEPSKNRSSDDYAKENDLILRRFLPLPRLSHQVILTSSTASFLINFLDSVIGTLIFIG